MSIEKQIRQLIEGKIREKCSQIGENDIVSFFESRTPDSSGAGEEEESTFAGMMKCEVRVLITTDTKTDLDLSQVFFYWMRLPKIKIETKPKIFEAVDIRLSRCQGDLEKDHFKQENLWFDVVYPVYETGDETPEREYVVDDGDTDNSFIEKRFNNAF